MEGKEQGPQKLIYTFMGQVEKEETHKRVRRKS